MILNWNQMIYKKYSSQQSRDVFCGNISPKSFVAVSRSFQTDNLRQKNTIQSKVAKRRMLCPKSLMNN